MRCGSRATLLVSFFLFFAPERRPKGEGSERLNSSNLPRILLLFAEKPLLLCALSRVGLTIIRQRHSRTTAVGRLSSEL